LYNSGQILKISHHQSFYQEQDLKITKNASVTWSGGIKDGKGAISTESGALTNQPYGFNTRFEGVKGTNPEELIGAAHAGCFTMALSMILGEAKLTATKLETTAQVTIEQKNGGFEISAIHLTLKGNVPGANQTLFKELANKAKHNCPVSKLVNGNTNVTLEAMLDT
jgi:osmotically inducible protein OsmC